MERMPASARSAVVAGELVLVIATALTRETRYPPHLSGTWWNESPMSRIDFKSLSAGDFGLIAAESHAW